MTNYVFEEEKQKYSFIDNGIVLKEVKNSYGSFLFKKALDYEVEQATNMNYYELINYNLAENESTINLVWMSNDDSINLVKNGQHQFIKNIIVNIDNLVDSKLPSDDCMFSNLTIGIRNTDDSKLSNIRKFKDLMSFIDNNAKCIDRIEVYNAPRIIEELANARLESKKEKFKERTM